MIVALVVLVALLLVAAVAISGNLDRIAKAVEKMSNAYEDSVHEDSDE